MAWGDWLGSVRAALIQILGVGPKGNDGADLPMLRSIDTLTLMGQVTPALASCILRYNAQVNSGTPLNAAIVTTYLGDQGVPISTDATDSPGVLMVPPYLAAAPQRDDSGIVTDAVQRTFSDGQTYSIWCQSADDQAQALYNFAKQTIADWQRCLESSSATILANSADTTQPIDEGGAQELWAALSALCSDLDDMQENPPTSVDINTLSQALKYSLSQTTKFVGESAGQIAAEVGSIAGDAASSTLNGFLGSASKLTLAVAGLVIFLYLR